MFKRKQEDLLESSSVFRNPGQLFDDLADHLDDDVHRSVQRVYKYRPLSQPWSLHLLEQNELWFSCPNVFNDPFDCRIPVRFEEASEEQVIALFTEVLLLDEPELDQHAAREQIVADLKQFDQQDAEQTLHMKRRFTDSLNRLFGIVSLSASPDDILMWSHYADAHRGYCIGLDVESLYAWSSDLHRQGKEIRLVRVRYERSMPVLDPVSHKRSEMILTTVTTKAQPWSYEQEFRLLGLELAGKSIKVPEEVIAEVILGYQISDENKHRILDIVQKRTSPVRVFQARTRDTEFGIDLEPVKI